MKDLLKNKFTLDGKKVSATSSIRKMEKKLVFSEQKIRFHYPEGRNRLKNSFPIDEKMAGITGEKIQKMVSTSQKTLFH